jgi:hypothetical protein
MMIAVEFLVALLAGVTLAALYELVSYRRSEQGIETPSGSVTSNLDNLNNEARQVF